MIHALIVLRRQFFGRALSRIGFRQRASPYLGERKLLPVARYWVRGRHVRLQHNYRIPRHLLFCHVEAQKGRAYASKT